MIVESNADLPQYAAGPRCHALAITPEPFGDLLAAISHEIRTPLTAVIGFCELMGREIFGPVGDPRYAAYVRHIADGGAALLKSAEDTLALSASSPTETGLAGPKPFRSTPCSTMFLLPFRRLRRGYRRASKLR
jgi:signal transduction histidine kinase